MKTRTSDFAWFAVIVAVGLNLRPLLTSISPLMSVILKDTGLSFQVKTRFAARLPFAMGLYSASIMAGGGLGASITPGVAARFSWETGLAVWALPALIALVVWTILMRHAAGHASSRCHAWRPCRAVAVRESSRVAARPVLRAGQRRLYESRRVTACVLSATRAGREAKRRTARHADGVSGIFRASPADGRIAFRQWFGHARDRRAWIVLGLLAQLIGFGMLLYAPLAAFVQGVGFVIAAVAPVIAGIVRDASGGFMLSWAMLAASLVAMIALSMTFGPKGYARARHQGDAMRPEPTASTAALR